MIPSSMAKKEYAGGTGDIHFRDLYVSESLISKQKKRYVEAIERFEDIYEEKDISIYSAPGRSEICGNHTDHQHGIVLAASVNLDTIAVVAPRIDSQILIQSEGYESISISIENLSLKERETGTTAALVRGVCKYLLDAGYMLGGFEAYITSDVPAGAGLSSSASFEVVIGTVLSGLYNKMSIDPILLAQAAQYAENVYFGKPCGLMDQMACAVGGLIHIDFANPNNPLVTREALDLADYSYSLCIVDTKGSHADLTEDYAQIPKEMTQIASHFGVSYLRDCDANLFFASIPKLRKLYGDRAVLRAFHFFDEQKRVEAVTKALDEKNFTSFLNLIKQSGLSSFHSLQNVYSPHDLAHQNLSIALALSEQVLGDKGVCRVHGGGFAGTIQAIVQDDFVSTYRTKMDTVFGTGACKVLKIRNIGGMQII